MNADLVRMSEWLLKEGCTHVATESTGSYWRPVFNVLERMEAFPANASRWILGSQADRDLQIGPGRLYVALLQPPNLPLANGPDRRVARWRGAHLEPKRAGRRRPNHQKVAGRYDQIQAHIENDVVLRQA